MAVEKNCDAKVASAPLEQFIERGVIGFVQLLDPGQRDIETQRLGIDLFLIGDDAGYGAKSADDADCLRVGIGGQLASNERRIQLVRFAVDVQIGPREMGVHQWRAKIDHRHKQSLDVRILGFAQGQGIQPRG